jgi:large subunit ribosomal protein L21
MESVLRITGIEGAGEKAKWDGETSLMTKLEMNARARGLAPRVEATEEAAPAPKAAKAPAAKKAPAKKAAAASTDEA